MKKRKKAKKNEMSFSTQEEKHVIQVPHEFYCPITRQIMLQPVVASDGRSYERSAIERWHREAQTSPFTRQPISSEFYANHELSSLIEAFVTSFPQFRQEQMSLAESQLVPATPVEIRRVVIRPFQENPPIPQAENREEKHPVEMEEMRMGVCDQLTHTFYRMTHHLMGFFDGVPDHKVERREPLPEWKLEGQDLIQFENERLNFILLALRGAGPEFQVLAALTFILLLKNRDRVGAWLQHPFFHRPAPNAADHDRHLGEGVELDDHPRIRR